MAAFFRPALALAALPLVLGLAACNKEPSATESGAAGPVAAPLPKAAAPATKAWADTVSITPEGGYVMGNPAAAIKIVEYGSLTCPHCAEVADKGSATIRDQWVQSGRVSFEFRNFVRDSLDVTMAMMTRCGAPESYFALTEQVFANQSAIFQKAQGNQAALEAAANLPDAQRFGGIAQAAGLTDFFAARGISKDQAAQCLAKSDVATTLAGNTQKQAEQYKIEGTPTFLINGEVVGSLTWEELKARIENMGVR